MRKKSYYVNIRVQPKDQIWYSRLVGMTTRFERDQICVRALRRAWRIRTKPTKAPEPASDISIGAKQIPLSLLLD